jgi:AraC family transcriptional regulator
MQPKISDVRQIILIGMSFYGDPFDLHSGWDEENQIGCLWKRFLDYLSRHPEITQNPNQTNAMYEVHIYNEETQKKGLFDVFVGMESNSQDIRDVSIELSVKILPLTRYAIFTFSGEEITSDWEKVLQNWLTKSGYRSTHSFNFQYYDDRFKGLDNLEESVLDVYFPIVEAA